MKYERASGRFHSTKLGRIASHYYVTYNLMSVYNQHLRSSMLQLKLFRVFDYQMSLGSFPCAKRFVFHFTGWWDCKNNITNITGKA